MRYFLFNYRYTYTLRGQVNSGEGSVWFESKKFPNKMFVADMVADVLVRPFVDYFKEHPEEKMRYSPQDINVTVRGWSEFKDKADYDNWNKEIAPQPKAH